MCKQPLNWKQKIAKWLTGEEFNKYDYLYASRKVIQNQYYNPNVSLGFYGVDFRHYADAIVRPCLQPGMTAYYEIVGYLPNGGHIQKLGNLACDYGCVPPSQDEKYEHGKHFKVLVYRITLTSITGHVHEFSAKEVQQWCYQMGISPVVEYYYGFAKDLYPDLNLDEHWNENFLQRLANDKQFFMECNSPTCANKVPHEGLVIKIENMKSEAFKLKCFKFLDAEGKALDKGETNIEDEA